jgi:type IV pilus assembly protein PilE
MEARQVKKNRQPGFSMVELMIVTALLALIMTLAVPSFRGLTLRAHRTEAISGLLQAASCQERVRAASGLYDTARCLPAVSDRYSYRFDPPGMGDTPSFSVYAEPLGAQSADGCGTMILGHDGRRQVDGSTSDVHRCWTGR